VFYVFHTILFKDFYFFQALNYVLCFAQVFIVNLWLNSDRFLLRLNTVAANDPSTQSIIAEFFYQLMTDSKLLAGMYDLHLCVHTTSYGFKIFFSDLKHCTKNITTMHSYISP
jgi:hypothetical protein